MFLLCWSGLEDDVMSCTCIQPLGVIHTSPRITIRSPGLENQYSMLVLRWSFFDGRSDASFFLVRTLPKIRSRRRSFRWDTLRKLIDGGREEMNPATPEEDPLLLLFTLTQTPSFVSIRSPYHKTLSPLFSHAKKVSQCSIIHKKFIEKFILNREIWRVLV